MLRLLLPLSAAILPHSVSGVGRVVPLLSGCHLDDIMRDTRLDRPPSLIALYDSTPGKPCTPISNEIIEQDLALGHQLPPREHLFIGKFDWRRLDDIWWKWRDEGDTRKYDLFARFNATRCPAFVVLPAADTVDPAADDAMSFDRHGGVLWQGGDVSWREWVRDALGRDVTVANNLPFPVTVSAESYDGAKLLHATAKLENRGKATVRVPVGARLTAVTAEQEEVWRRTVRSGGAEDCQYMVIDQDHSPGHFAAHAAELESLRKRGILLNGRDQTTTFQHSAITKQPPVMPSHEAEGVSSYKVIDMPAALLERLRKFYETHQHRRSFEALPDETTGINALEVKPTMVSFDLDTAERDDIAQNLIRPLVQEWARVPLEFTTLYGIREYYRGSELRMHVDRVATHVFSGILNVHQEGIEEEWPLDMIDFDGTAKSVTIKPGQMVLYQSAKLVHGRPRPLRGEKYASVFCHFRPANGWQFDYRPGDLLYRDGNFFIDYKVD